MHSSGDLQLYLSFLKTHDAHLYPLPYHDYMVAKHHYCHRLVDGTAAVWMTLCQNELACGDKTSCLVPGATTSSRVLTKTKS